MSISRLTHITKIGVEQMGDLADSLKDPDLLRPENLDTDLRPPPSALEFTKRAVDDDAANSYLPFFGLDVMRQAAVKLVERQSVSSRMSAVGMSPRWLTNFDKPRNVCGIDLQSCDSVSFMLVVRFSNLCSDQ